MKVHCHFCLSFASHIEIIDDAILLCVIANYDKHRMKHLQNQMKCKMLLIYCSQYPFAFIIGLPFWFTTVIEIIQMQMKFLCKYLLKTCSFCCIVKIFWHTKYALSSNEKVKDVFQVLVLAGRITKRMYFLSS